MDCQSNLLLPESNPWLEIMFMNFLCGYKFEKSLYILLSYFDIIFILSPSITSPLSCRDPLGRGPLHAAVGVPFLVQWLAAAAATAVATAVVAADVSEMAEVGFGRVNLE